MPIFPEKSSVPSAGRCCAAGEVAALARPRPPPGRCGPTCRVRSCSIGSGGRLVVTSSDGSLAAWAAADLNAAAGPTPVLALAGGTQGWARC